MIDHPRGNGPPVGWPPSDDAPAETDPDAKPEPATKDGLLLEGPLPSRKR